MRTYLMVISAAALAACGQSTDKGAANQAAANAAQPKKKVAYCFFKDDQTKGWSAARDKDGNIVVKGKAFRSDARYQALFGPPTVTGTTAEISPTIQQNATGFAAPENWWDMSSTIPNSAAIDTVKVTCGAKTLAELKVAPKG
ncbi:MAG TPA: hypothetical protein VJT70_03215 [Sphingomicrobium sp.]|nr:hypothetical protein [Sphingomicrobium sp.]